MKSYKPCSLGDLKQAAGLHSAFLFLIIKIRTPVIYTSLFNTVVARSDHKNNSKAYSIAKCKLNV
jgi:hypothetical protein